MRREQRKIPRRTDSSNLRPRRALREERMPRLRRWPVWTIHECPYPRLPVRATTNRVRGCSRAWKARRFAASSRAAEPLKVMTADRIAEDETAERRQMKKKEKKKEKNYKRRFSIASKNIVFCQILTRCTRRWNLVTLQPWRRGRENIFCACAVNPVNKCRVLGGCTLLFLMQAIWHIFKTLKHILASLR